jgi:hypothetical protein
VSEDWIEREVAHSRRVIANAKLVVTFSAALAATFVATFLDKTDAVDPKNYPPNIWDEVALICMAVTLLLTVRVILLRHKPHEGELKYWVFTDAKRVADQAHRFTVTQVIFSLMSVVAVVCQVRYPWYWH